MNRIDRLFVITLLLQARGRVIRAARATTSDLRLMAGYGSRELLRSEEGQWVDIVHWSARDQALAAAERFPALPGAQAFGSLMGGESIRMMHLEQMTAYLVAKSTRNDPGEIPGSFRVDLCWTPARYRAPHLILAVCPPVYPAL